MASLKELGLSEYEARAYRSLLEAGPTTAKELSNESGVPMGRIYDVLKSIEENDLVRTQTAFRPKRYVAVDPSTALDRLLAARKRELDERAEQYETAADELLGELSKGDSAGGTFRTTAVGPAESAELLLERIAASESRILVALSGGAAPFFESRGDGRRPLDALVDATERGIDVELLVSPPLASRLRAAEDGKREPLLDHDRVSIRIAEDVAGSVALFDDREVAVGVSNPLAEGELFGVLDITDPPIVGDIRTEFERRRRDATEITR